MPLLPLVDLYAYNAYGGLAPRFNPYTNLIIALLNLINPIYLKYFRQRIA